MSKPAPEPFSETIIPISRVTTLLRSLQVAVQWRAGKPPTYLDMEEWTGVAEGTLKDWLNHKGRPTAEFILNLLDRVPPQSRQEILGATCRSDPRLNHPRLQCDRTVISSLKTIITRPAGLTCITGESDEAKTFVMSALGHSFLFLTDRPRRVCGVDSHEPDWFVPVPGLHYCQNEDRPDRLREAVSRVWPEIEKGRHRLILLNGVWEANPGLHRAIIKLANRNPVIVAVTKGIEAKLLKNTQFPSHVITVTEDAKAGRTIRVEITTT